MVLRCECGHEFEDFHICKGCYQAVCPHCASEHRERHQMEHTEAMYRFIDRLGD